MVKAKRVDSFSPKTMNNTALRCPFCFYSFTLSSLAHLPRTIINNNSQYHSSYMLRDLWSRVTSRNNWNKAACSVKVGKGLMFGTMLFGSAPILHIARKQLQVRLYTALYTIRSSEGDTAAFPKGTPDTIVNTFKMHWLFTQPESKFLTY